MCTFLRSQVTIVIRVQRRLLKRRLRIVIVIATLREVLKEGVKLQSAITITVIDFFTFITDFINFTLVLSFESVFSKHVSISTTHKQLLMRLQREKSELT